MVHRDLVVDAVGVGQLLDGVFVVLVGIQAFHHRRGNARHITDKAHAALQIGPAKELDGGHIAKGLDVGHISAFGSGGVARP